MAASGPASRPVSRSLSGSPSRAPVRRRQRSVRVTVAVTLLSVATVCVLVSIPTRSPLWLSVGSLTALALSWAALRIMWTEVLQSRRENAADRAAAARAYRELFTVRAAEHAEFTTAMTERLAEAHLTQRELEGLIVHQRRRADLAESRASELEQSLAVRTADGGVADPVVELVTWEEKQAVPQARGAGRAARKRA